MKIFNKMSVVVIVVVFMLGVAGLVIIRKATVVDLSSKDNFAVLEGSTGDFGLIPGLPIVGEPLANSDY